MEVKASLGTDGTILSQQSHKIKAGGGQIPNDPNELEKIAKGIEDINKVANAP